MYDRNVNDSCIQYILLLRSLCIYAEVLTYVRRLCTAFRRVGIPTWWAHVENTCFRISQNVLYRTTDERKNPNKIGNITWIYNNRWKCLMFDTWLVETVQYLHGWCNSEFQVDSIWNWKCLKRRTYRRLMSIDCSTCPDEHCPSARIFSVLDCLLIDIA